MDAFRTENLGCQAYKRHRSWKTLGWCENRRESLLTTADWSALKRAKHLAISKLVLAHFHVHRPNVYLHRLPSTARRSSPGHACGYNANRNFSFAILQSTIRAHRLRRFRLFAHKLTSCESQVVSVVHGRPVSQVCSRKVKKRNEWNEVNQTAAKQPDSSAVIMKLSLWKTKKNFSMSTPVILHHNAKWKRKWKDKFLSY